MITTVSQRTIDEPEFVVARHPYESSRLLLAQCCVLVPFAAVSAVIAGDRGLGALLGFYLALGVVGGVVGAVVYVGLQVFRRAHLLGDAVRVTDRTLPELQASLEDVCRQLHYHEPVDVYVAAKAPSPTFVTSFFGTRIILLEGDFVADLQKNDDGQLRFLLGSCIGAFKARHDRLIPLMLRVIDAFKSVWILRAIVRPYYRATAYSGDQIAYLCCGDLRSALNMMTRSLVGKDMAVAVATRGLLEQADNVRRRYVPRCAQIFFDSPHLTNRYLNLLAFAECARPADLTALRAELDAETNRLLDQALEGSLHRRAARAA